MNLYEELKAAGVPLDSHESDLYALVTPASREIVSRHRVDWNVAMFRSQIDGKVWFDLPFAFMPFWERRAGKVAE